MFTQYLDIKKWAIPGLFFFIFIFSIRLTVNVQYQFLLMAGFEPQTSGLGSDRTTNSATTTANIWTFRTTLVQKWTEFSKVGSKYWNPQKVAKYFYPFAKVAKFCQIWSHWLFSTNWRKRKRWKNLTDAQNWSGPNIVKHFLLWLAANRLKIQGFLAFLRIFFTNQRSEFEARLSFFL